MLNDAHFRVVHAAMRGRFQRASQKERRRAAAQSTNPWAALATVDEDEPDEPSPTDAEGAAEQKPAFKWATPAQGDSSLQDEGAAVSVVQAIVAGAHVAEARRATSDDDEDDAPAVQTPCFELPLGFFFFFPTPVARAEFVYIAQRLFFWGEPEPCDSAISLKWDHTKDLLASDYSWWGRLNLHPYMQWCLKHTYETMQAKKFECTVDMREVAPFLLAVARNIGHSVDSNHVLRNNINILRAAILCIIEHRCMPAHNYEGWSKIKLYKKGLSEDVLKSRDLVLYDLFGGVYPVPKLPDAQAAYEVARERAHLREKAAFLAHWREQKEPSDDDDDDGNAAYAASVAAAIARCRAGPAMNKHGINRDNDMPLGDGWTVNTLARAVQLMLIGPDACGPMRTSYLVAHTILCPPREAYLYD
jgi:hypothetical protein